MAVVQAQADKAGLGDTLLADSDGYLYHPFGSIRIYVGTGTPNGVITAPMGSLYIEVGAGELYIKDTNATGTAWTAA